MIPVYCIVCPPPRVVFYHHIFGPVYPLLPPLLLSVSMSFSFISHVEVMSYGSSIFLTDLFSMIFSRSIHAVTNGRISSSLMAEKYSTVYMWHTYPRLVLNDSITIQIQAVRGLPNPKITGADDKVSCIVSTFFFKNFKCSSSYRIYLFNSVR